MFDVADHGAKWLTQTATDSATHCSTIDTAVDGRAAPTQTPRTEAGGEPVSVRAPISPAAPGSPYRGLGALAVQILAMVCLGWTVSVLLAAGHREAHTPPAATVRPATEQERRQHDAEQLAEVLRRMQTQTGLPDGAVTVPAPLGT